MMMAPIAGPMMRAALNWVELRAMALVRSSVPTISGTNAWRIGPSHGVDHSAHAGEHRR